MQICWNFFPKKKNVSSFCSAKATHIFSAKNIRILYIESAKTVNEMTLTTLWTTGPRVITIQNTQTWNVNAGFIPVVLIGYKALSARHQLMTLDLSRSSFMSMSSIASEYRCRNSSGNLSSGNNRMQYVWTNLKETIFGGRTCNRSGPVNP